MVRQLRLCAAFEASEAGAEVCPITQKPLRLEECQADPEMKKRTVKLNCIVTQYR